MESNLTFKYVDNKLRHSTQTRKRTESLGLTGKITSRDEQRFLPSRDSDPVKVLVPLTNMYDNTDKEVKIWGDADDSVLRSVYGGRLQTYK